MKKFKKRQAQLIGMIKTEAEIVNLNFRIDGNYRRQNKEISRLFDLHVRTEEAENSWDLLPILDEVIQ